METAEISKKKIFNEKSLSVNGNTIYGLFFVFFALAYFLFAAPVNFNIDKSIYIDSGANLRSVSRMLKEDGVIRSRVIFETLIILYEKEKKILPGDYVFKKNSSVFSVVNLISNGGRELNSVRITIPEGFNINEIGNLMSKKLPDFNLENFKNIAKDKEGYLFPDTYFFLNTDNENDVLLYMNENFKKKTEMIYKETESLGKSFDDIVTMASIIEKEAKGDNDRKLISGVLWKRISINMPLQADAAPSTYNILGLPSKPIANPGLASLDAALYPESSPYLYYLHDKEGNIHFAKNFEDHKKNKAQYLR